MTSLNISNNSLVGTSPNVYVPNRYNCGDLVEYDGKMRPIEAVSLNGEWYRVWIFDGIIALADALKNNGTMTSLNISWNYLLAEGAKHIAAALPECK